MDKRVLSTYLLNVALFHPHMFEASRENTHCWEVIYTCQHGTRHFHLQMVCYVILELIVERDHSAAQNVTSHSQCQIFWSKMREQVLVRNHSTAQHATRHFHHQMVHVFMAFQIFLVCGWKNYTWIKAFSFWFLGPIQSMNTMQVNSLPFTWYFCVDERMILG